MPLSETQLGRLSQLLTNPQMSQSDIARELGFENQSNFRYHLRESGYYIDRTMMRTLKPYHPALSADGSAEKVAA